MKDIKVNDPAEQENKASEQIWTADDAANSFDVHRMDSEHQNRKEVSFLIS